MGSKSAEVRTSEVRIVRFGSSAPPDFFCHCGESFRSIVPVFRQLTRGAQSGRQSKNGFSTCADSSTAHFLIHACRQLEIFGRSFRPISGVQDFLGNSTRPAGSTLELSFAWPTSCLKTGVWSPKQCNRKRSAGMISEIQGMEAVHFPVQRGSDTQCIPLYSSTGGAEAIASGCQ